MVLLREIFAGNNKAHKLFCLKLSYVYMHYSRYSVRRRRMGLFLTEWNSVEIYRLFSVIQ